MFFSGLTICQNKFWQRLSDGDQATNESKDEEKDKEVKKVTKEVKDIQATVRNITSQDQEFLPGSSGSHPVLVQLIANDPEGVSAYTAHPPLP